MLPGVDDLLAQTSVESSLSPHNRAAVDGWLKPQVNSAYDEAKIRLLFDPQTSGGLLIGVARAEVDQCLEQLQRAGYLEAVAIGEVIPRIVLKSSLARPISFLRTSFCLSFVCFFAQAAKVQ